MAYTLVPTELIVDGAVTSAKLDTNITISGTLGVTGELTLSTHMNMGDNDKIKIGTGGDLEIYHDGSNSYISNSTGNIYLADTNGSVHIQAKLNEDSLVAEADGAVTLYHDNSPKLATSSAGVTVTGNVTASTGSFTRLDINATNTQLKGDLFAYTDAAYDIGASGANRPRNLYLSNSINAADITTTGAANIGAGMTVDTSTLVVDATNNRVGIGTTSPDNKLEIQHGTIGTGNGQNNTLALRYNSTTLYGQHYMDANGLYHIRADAQGVSGGNLILGGDNSVQIWTGSTPESRVTVDSSGDVNIGTTGAATGSHKLVVESASTTGTVNSHIALIGDSATNGQGPQILFSESGDGQSYAGGTIGFTRTSSNSIGDLLFGTRGSSGDASTTTTERMRISSNGSIGFGTSDSTYSMSIQNIVSSDVMLQIKNTTANEDTGIFIDAVQGGAATNSRIGHSVVAGNNLLQITNPNGHAFYTGTSSLTESLRIDSTGLVKINVNNNSYNFQAYASSSNSFFGVWDDSNDSANIQIDRSDTATVFYVLGHTGNYHFAGSDVSDRDLKENIVDVPNGSLELVKQLKPRTYNFKSSEGFDNSSRTGFIAQEVADVMTTDHRVASGIDGNKDMGIDPVGLIAHLTKAIQEQQTIIDDLKSRIETLENE